MHPTSNDLHYMASNVCIPTLKLAEDMDILWAASEFDLSTKGSRTYTEIYIHMYIIIASTVFEITACNT